MRIAITGADGFLGSHLADELVRHEVHIRALLPPGVAAARLDQQGIDTATVDPWDRDALADALAGADFVINARGLDRPGLPAEAYEHANVHALTALLDACRDLPLRGVIHCSSAEIYGDALPAWPVDEGWVPRPRGRAARSQALAERAARTYRRSVPLVILRPALVFGARDTGLVQALLLHFLAHPGAPLVVGGDAPTSLAYGPDCGRAVWDVLTRFDAAVDGIYHVKSFDTDWRTLLEEAFHLLHRRLRPRAVPGRLAPFLPVLIPAYRRDPFLRRPLIDRLSRPHLIDDTRLRTAVDFHPIFGLRSALRQTLDGLREARPDLQI